MKRRIAFAIVAALALVVGAMSSALTAVDAANAKVWLSSGTTSARNAITIYGSGFPARKSVTITFNGKPIATAKTSQQGGFSKRWIVPSTTLSGTYVIRTSSGKVSAETTLQVGTVAPAPAPAAPTPTPAPPAPTPTPVTTPVAPTESEQASCSTSLQSVVDAAAPGSVVAVPGCVYRETVTINKPLVLDGAGVAELKGSDIWKNWTRSGNYWIAGTLPAFSNHGVCRADTSRCTWPEQVYVDGNPLQQVAANPASGQFAVNGARQVVLADDPNGRIIEVTTREFWIVGRSSDVTIQGFKMRHAANPAQSGAISNSGYNNWVIQHNTFAHAHGANVSLSGGSNLKLVNNDINYGGQLGVHGSQATDVLVQNNRISASNTEEFEPSWEAGGLKMATMTRLTLDGNEVFDNRGPGLWCDIDCRDTVVRTNRVHHNARSGVIYELSHGIQMHDNVIWENGYNNHLWGWGAGILIQNSSSSDIFNNIVAWNADGISVISQDRGHTVWNAVSNNNIHDNSIVSVARHEYHDFSLAWLQDWSGKMAAPESNNRGANNRYYHANPQNAWRVFSWADGKEFAFGGLTDFNATPGEESGRYLSAEEMVAILQSAGVATGPEPR